LIRLLLVIIAINIVFVRSSTAEDDIRRGLIALYNSTGGNQRPPLWIHGRSWGTDPDYCNWEGITCISPAPNPRVFVLNQDAGGLAGYIPSQIGLLGKYVQSLQLNRNTIVGSLPSTISQLINLVQLDVQQNSLNGTIPTTFASMNNLQMFWIAGNHITGTVGVALQPVLVQCAAHQPLGCRMAGNPFTCPVPNWVPQECGMGCMN